MWPMDVPQVQQDVAKFFVLEADIQGLCAESHWKECPAKCRVLGPMQLNRSSDSHQLLECAACAHRRAC